MFAQDMHGAQSDFITDREDRIERLAALCALGDQRGGGAAALFLAAETLFDGDKAGLAAQGAAGVGVTVVTLLELALRRGFRGDADDLAIA